MYTNLGGEIYHYGKMQMVLQHNNNLQSSLCYVTSCPSQYTTLKTDAEYLSETTVPIYQRTHQHIPDRSKLLTLSNYKHV